MLHGDVLLDAVALLHEALVLRAGSRRAAYLRALPLRYPLPVMCR